MALPLATTTVSITRPVIPAGADPYDSTPTYTVIASGVRAVIDVPMSAKFRLIFGDRVVYDASMSSDPTDVEVGDTVTDLTSNQAWIVEKVQQVYHLGMAHTLAGLRYTTGAT